LNLARDEFRQRTKQFALRVIRAVKTLQRDKADWELGRQLLRCGTSVGANYRAACRARSTAEFIAKLGIVEEEADEAVFWMEVMIESGIMRPEQLGDLMDEANQILKMTIASIKTARNRKT